MKERQNNDGLRKRCDCPRRRRPKCQHSWHFNFKPKGGPAYRFAVDIEAGSSIDFDGRRDARWLRREVCRAMRTASQQQRPRLSTTIHCVRDYGVALGDGELRSLTADTIEVFFASLRKAGRAASTRNKFVQAIKAAAAMGDEKGLRRSQPARRLRQHHARTTRSVVDVCWQTC